MPAIRKTDTQILFSIYNGLFSWNLIKFPHSVLLSLARTHSSLSLSLPPLHPMKVDHDWHLTFEELPNNPGPPRPGAGGYGGWGWGVLEELSEAVLKAAHSQTLIWAANSFIEQNMKPWHRCDACPPAAHLPNCLSDSYRLYIYIYSSSIECSEGLLSFSVGIIGSVVDGLANLSSIPLFVPGLYY